MWQKWGKATVYMAFCEIIQYTVMIIPMVANYLWVFSVVIAQKLWQCSEGYTFRFPVKTLYNGIMYCNIIYDENFSRLFKCWAKKCTRLWTWGLPVRAVKGLMHSGTECSAVHIFREPSFRFMNALVIYAFFSRYSREFFAEHGHSRQVCSPLYRARLHLVVVRISEDCSLVLWTINHYPLVSVGASAASLSLAASLHSTPHRLQPTPLKITAHSHTPLSYWNVLHRQVRWRGVWRKARGRISWTPVQYFIDRSRYGF